MSESDFDWEEARQTVGASEKQMKFCQELLKGASLGRAAIAAGYSSDTDHAARSQGHAASRSSKVQALLALARAGGAGSADDLLTQVEAKRILAGMARRGDNNAKVRAIQALQTIEVAEKEAGAAQQADGLSVDRVARNFMLDNRDGALAFALCWSGSSGALSRLPLFHDIAPRVQRDWPDVWAKLVERQSETMKLDLKERFADPDWQRHTREKVWGEIGFVIDANNEARPDPDGRKFIPPTAKPPGMVMPTQQEGASNG